MNTGIFTLSITFIELSSTLKWFRLLGYSFQISNQLKSANCVAFKTRRGLTKHYTMTLWRNEKEKREFVLNGDHLYALKNAKKIAREVKILSIETEGLISWTEGRLLLEKRGRTISL